MKLASLPDGRPQPGTTAVLCLMIALMSGCGVRQSGAPATQPADSGAAPITLPELPAAEYLKQVFARYRSTQSYHDRGEVRLRVEKGGRLSREIAPMHVVLDGSTIWVAAYDARVWSDAGKTLGWIADEQSDFHDSQVVVGGSSAAEQSSSRPILDNLLRDPILTARMISGLGGPPPQLEWLLDPEPMRKLFADQDSADGSSNSENLIEYEGLANRDQIQCVVVRAVADHDEYKFWIDPLTSLIHYVDLPVAMAGKQVELDGWKVHSLELVLSQASFDPPLTPYKLADMPRADLPEHPKYVRSLVPLPPSQPDRRIGTSVATFESTDVTGQKTVTESGIDRAFTLWFRCRADAGPEAAIENLHAATIVTNWLAQAPAEIRSDIRPISLADGDNAQFLVDGGITNTEWSMLMDHDAKFAGCLGLQPGQAMVVDWRGKIIWTSAVITPSTITTVAAAVANARAGIDIAEQIRQQWDADQLAYQEKVRQLTIQSAINPL